MNYFFVSSMPDSSCIMFANTKDGANMSYDDDVDNDIAEVFQETFPQFPIYELMEHVWEIDSSLSIDSIIEQIQSDPNWELGTSGDWFK